MEMFELKKDQVYNHLRKEIVSGRLRSGKLPRETELAKSLGVGKVTLRDSLSRLEDEGYIKRIHGKGTFVYSDGAVTAAATIMVIHGAESGIEMPWRYIVPEIPRYAAEKHLKAFVTTDAAIHMFSESAIRDFVKSRHIIGIVAVMSRFNGQEPILTKMRAAGVPIVIAHGKEDDVKATGLPCITVSEKDSWEAAIAYLAGIGHRRIAMIGHCFNFRDCSMAEILQLLKKYHASVDESLIRSTDFNRQDIIKTAKSLCLNPLIRPTAILCFSDFFAIYVYDALKELKLRIPHDVAVMGICGYPDAWLLNPPLSTIDYGYAKFAEMAVEMLQEPGKWFDPVTGKGKLRLNPFKLIKRESTEPESKT